MTEKGLLCDQSFPPSYERNCRSCGSKLNIIQICHVCNEPVMWFCLNCSLIYDSVHIHNISNLCLKNGNSIELPEGENI
jgi:hypothetical protein